MNPSPEAEMPPQADDAIRAFDHRSLAGRPEYVRLARSIEALAEAGIELDPGEFVAMVRDMAARRAAADPCPRCSVAAYPRFALPLAAEVVGEVVTCRYVCAGCGTAWSTAWSTQFEQATEAVEPGREREGT